MHKESCDKNNREKECYTTQAQNEKIDLSKHWDKVFLNNPEERLGWYETDLTPTLNLILKTELNKSARILNVGAGSTTLIDELIKIGYSNLLATDLSKIALKKLEDRLGSRKIECIVDDLTKPTKLKNIASVDLWIDRAVLHFITDKIDQDTYFDLLNSKIKSNGFALIAEFNLSGATMCSGLPVHRYNKEMLIEKLENNFELVESFEHTYIMPSGGERPYIYTLFRKK